MEDYLYIGRIANAHGIMGALKVFPTTDDPTRFEQLKDVLIEDTKGNTIKCTMKKIQYSGQFVLLTVKEITDMNGALSLKGGLIKIPRELALPLEEDEYYICDLIGLEVYDIDGNLLGKLSDILFTGSNDVYVVDDGTKNGLLLPAIKDCIQDIDIKAKKIVVKVLEGLKP